MSKAPILILGGAAVIVAIVASQKSGNDTATSAIKPAPAPPRPTRTLQSLSQAQKVKLEDWAKKKGVPVDKALALAKDLFTTEI